MIKPFASKAFAVFLFLFTLIDSGIAAQVGNWLLDVKEDPVTGETEYLAISLASSYPGEALNEASLGIFCSTPSQSLSVGVFTGVFIGMGNDYAEVLYRINKEQPENDKWLVSPKGTLIFPNDSFGFLKKLVRSQARRLAIRVWDYRKVAYTYIFDLDGLTDVLQEIPCTQDIEEVIKRDIEMEQQRKVEAQKKLEAIRFWGIELPGRAQVLKDAEAPSHIVSLLKELADSALCMRAAQIHWRESSNAFQIPLDFNHALQQAGYETAIEFLEKEPQGFSMAGKIVASRDSGKMIFSFLVRSHEVWGFLCEPR